MCFNNCAISSVKGDYLGEGQELIRLSLKNGKLSSSTLLVSYELVEPRHYGIFLKLRLMFRKCLNTSAVNDREIQISYASAVWMSSFSISHLVQFNLFSLSLLACNLRVRLVSTRNAYFLMFRSSKGVDKQFQLNKRGRMSFSQNIFSRSY